MPSQHKRPQPENFLTISRCTY